MTALLTATYREVPDCGYPGNNPYARCVLTTTRHACIIERGHSHACLCQCGTAYAFPDVANVDFGRWQWRGSLNAPRTRKQRRALRDAQHPYEPEAVRS